MMIESEIIRNYLFISPTVRILTGYLTITKLNTKKRKIIVKGFFD